MLFSALTNPQRISPWLDTLLANHIPLVGIYSLPNISTPLLKDIPSDHVLLLSWEKDAGLRQTYFNNKRLHFSRLIPINENSTFSESVATETPRTQQYLKSLSLPPPGEMLDVYIICDANDRLALQSRLEGEQRTALHLPGYPGTGQALQSQEQIHRFGCHPAAPAPARQQAAGKPLRQFRTHAFLFVVAIAAHPVRPRGRDNPLQPAFGAAPSFLQGRDYVAQTEPLNMQTEHLKQQTQQIQRSFANTTVPAADMKTAVLLTRKLNQYTPPPELILNELTLVLDQFTQITVNKLAWQASAADAAPSAYPAHVITFDGSLTGFGSDYRKALNYLDRFQQALTQRGYTVTVEKQPLDISSKGSISGDAQKNDGNPAQFTLKIIWRQKE